MIESSWVQENHRILGLPQCAACFNTDNPVVKMSSLTAPSSKLRLLLARAFKSVSYWSALCTMRVLTYGRIGEQLTRERRTELGRPLRRSCVNAQMLRSFPDAPERTDLREAFDSRNARA